MSALGPKLTPLDEAVLAQVPFVRGRRERAILGVLVARRRVATPDELSGILRGLEHLGLVRQAGGWWVRA